MFQEFTGREYLKIDVASNFGLDKADWDDRIKWFDNHENNLEDLVQEAKEPALFYAGVKAWREVCLGRPIGYMCSFDATSSGLQLLCALTGDRSGSELCNVVDTGHRRNAYTGIYKAMLETVGGEAQISAEQTKDAIMTALYGSTAMPKKVFGEGALLDVFYNTMNEKAPGAWELNEAFLSLWDNEALSNDWVLPDNFHVHIKVMSQVEDTVHFLNAPYDVTYKVNAPIDGGRSLGANTIHSVDGMIVREITRRCDYSPKTINYLRQLLASTDEGMWAFHALGCNRAKDHLVKILWDHYEASGYLSARILDLLDDINIGLVVPATILELVDSLPKKPFTVVSNHDCFRILPHYGNDLRRQYNLQLQLIAKSNLLSYLLSQIVGQTVNITKLDDKLHLDVIETNYALS